MNNQWFCVYTINKKNNCDELKMDFRNNAYEFNYNIDKRSLANIENKRIREFYVNKDFFESLSFMIQEHFDSGSEYCEAETYEEILEREKREAEEERNKLLIKKDTIWKALRLELSKLEMEKICTYDVAYEKGDYYDFELIEKTILDYINFKIDEELFSDWCWICMRCFTSECIKRDKELIDLYYQIGDTFDCWLFYLGRDEEGIKECYNCLSDIRYINHLITNKKTHKNKDYEKNGIVIYSCYETRIGGDKIYKVYIVDKKNKKANMKYVYNPKCNVDLRITFVSLREFDDISNQYCDYDYDMNLSELDQLK